MVAYAEQERERLAPGMPPRKISLCEDETYHPEICLVALEPVSGFILRECYAADRSAATWTRVLAQALDGLPVEVIQGTDDEAKGLLRHVERDLGAHHSPDVFHFHFQHKVSKAVALPLVREIEQARACVRELADAYHPYDLQSGAVQPVELVAKRFAACWRQLAELAEQIALPERARERIAKAERLARLAGVAETMIKASLAITFQPQLHPIRIE